jgi:hypothetical protein
MKSYVLIILLIVSRTILSPVVYDILNYIYMHTSFETKIFQ